MNPLELVVIVTPLPAKISRDTQFVPLESVATGIWKIALDPEEIIVPDVPVNSLVVAIEIPELFVVKVILLPAKMSRDTQLVPVPSCETGILKIAEEPECTIVPEIPREPLVI